MTGNFSFDASGRRVLRYGQRENIRNVLTAGLVVGAVVLVLSLLLFAVAGPVAIPLMIVVATMTFSLGAANALYFLVLRPYWPRMGRSRRWGVAGLVALAHAGPMFLLFFIAAGAPVIFVVPIVAIWTAVIYFQTKFRFERKPWTDVASPNDPKSGEETP